MLQQRCNTLLRVDWTHNLRNEHGSQSNEQHQAPMHIIKLPCALLMSAVHTFGYHSFHVQDSTVGLKAFMVAGGGGEGREEARAGRRLKHEVTSQT